MTWLRECVILRQRNSRFTVRDIRSHMRHRFHSWAQTFLTPILFSNCVINKLLQTPDYVWWTCPILHVLFLMQFSITLLSSIVNFSFFLFLFVFMLLSFILVFFYLTPSHLLFLYPQMTLHSCGLYPRNIITALVVRHFITTFLLMFCPIIQSGGALIDVSSVSDL